MRTQRNNIIKFNQYMRSDKTPCIIYADLKSLIKKLRNCKNVPEKSLTTRTGEHIPCEYSTSTICVFGIIKNKHNLYRGENCMKKFCIYLREDAADIINFEKRKMLPLTEKELKS